MRARIPAIALAAILLAGCSGSSTPAPSTPTATAGATTASPQASASPTTLAPWTWQGASPNDWVWVRASSATVFASSGPQYTCCANFFNGPGKVTALDAATGKELWTFATPTQPFPVVVVEGRAVFGTTGGTVFAVDASSGKLVWQHDFPGIPFQVISTASAVVVADGDPETWGPNGIADKTRLGGRVRALDPATGKQRWEATVRNFAVFVTPAGDDVVAASSSNSGSDDVALFDRDGKRKWLASVGAVSSAPVAAGGSVVVAGASLQKLDLATGQTLWLMPPRDGGTFFGPTALGDTVVAATNTHGLEARSLALGSLSALEQFPDCAFFPLEGSPYALACGALMRVELAPQSVSMSPVLIPQGRLQSAAFANGQVFFASTIGSAAPPAVGHLDPSQPKGP